MNQQAQIEFFQRLIGTSQTERAIFTCDVIDKIAEEFDISQANRDQMGLILEVGAHAFATEAQLLALDFKRIKQDLRALEKAAHTLASALDTLAPDTLELLGRSGFAQRLRDMPLPRITLSGTSHELEFLSPTTEIARSVSLSETSALAAALSQSAAFAHDRVSEYRKGRPENTALDDLLGFVFQIWESLLGRAFKLDWASNGEPITDAARFSVRIVRVVAPSTTLQQIATASRKVREKGQSFSNLEEVPQVVEHYRKQ